MTVAAHTAHFRVAAPARALTHHEVRSRFLLGGALH
jgi:hypothetical protein